MAVLRAFLFASLDGYYKDAEHSTQWHQHAQEAAEYSKKRLSEDGVLLFGRVTYDMMASFWPTDFAAQTYPEVAKKMSEAEKWVITHQAPQQIWTNTEILSINGIAEIAKRKKGQNKAITVLGSANLLTQLLNENLVDEIEWMIDPLALGAGYSPFEDLLEIQPLELLDIEKFEQSFQVLLRYRVLASQDA